MKLILRADVDHLGRLGDIVTVRPGYGRNFLIPQGLAMLATESNLKVFETERKKLQMKMDAVKAKAQEIAAKLEGIVISIPVRVGEGDKLYGSVTLANIADVLQERNIEIDRKKIILENAIRALGEYSVEVRLHPEVKAEIKVAVVKHATGTSEPGK